MKLFENDPSMMHAKSRVVDGVWCDVGALNLDSRSIAPNDEVAPMIHDAGLGARLAAIFEDGLPRAHRATLAERERDGWWDRARAWGASRTAPLL